MFRRILIAIGIVSAISIYTFPTNASSFSDDVFPWLTENNLTKYTDESDFRPRDAITRGEASKFVVNFAGLIGIEKTSTSCSFSDTKTYDSSLRSFTVEACEYGLFRGSNGRFLPSNNITEAQALAVVIRSAYGMQDENGKPWYSEYFSIAKELGIITTETLSSLDTKQITREKLATWLYQIERANADASTSSGNGETTIYETEATGPDDCSSYEMYDATRRVCAFECTTELECKTTQDKIDAELA
jgi:hypothetical protein